MHTLVFEGPGWFAEMTAPRFTQVQVPVVLAGNVVDRHGQLGENLHALLQLIVPAVLGDVAAIHHEIRPGIHGVDLIDRLGEKCVEFVILDAEQMRIGEDGKSEGRHLLRRGRGYHPHQTKVDPHGAGNERRKPGTSGNRDEIPATEIVEVLHRLPLSLANLFR